MCEGCEGEARFQRFDCYSDGEAEAMARSQELRAKILRPLVFWLARRGVRPSHITLASLLSGAAFCGVFLFAPAAALPLLALHVFLDGLDGPLARHMGVAS